MDSTSWYSKRWETRNRISTSVQETLIRSFKQSTRDFVCDRVADPVAAAVWRPVWNDIWDQWDQDSDLGTYPEGPT